MEIINEDLKIPYYIYEEMQQYTNQTIQGRCKCMKWENIKALLKLTQVNKRLSNQQVEYIIKTYCRE